MTARKVRHCTVCERELPEGTNGRVRKCDRCRKSDPHRNRGRVRPTMIVGCDCESAQNPTKHHVDLGLMENDMVTFSIGREDGSSASITAPIEEFLRPEQVWAFLHEQLGKEYIDANGKAWKQQAFGFHFNHDAGMLLKDMHTRKLALLHKATAKTRGLLCGREHQEDEEPCERYHWWNQDDCKEILVNGGESDYIAWDEKTKYAFSTTAGRRFYMEYRPNGWDMTGNVRIDIHDVGMAFPGKFESVIDKWQPELRPGDREIIAWGKQQRIDDFRMIDREKIAAYSEAECVATARLIRKFLNTLHQATGLRMRPDKLFGSGSVAGEVLKFNSVTPRKDIHMDESFVRGIEIDNIAQLCYYGGKIEGPTVGLLTEDAHPRDIRSAYPSQMIHLPCMADGHGKWVHRRGATELPARTVGYVLVDWMLPEGATQFPPFMVRDINASVFCPRVGQQTWVSLPEYRVATKYWEEYISVRHTLHWVQECECAPPLAFVSEVYTKRLAEKDRAKKALAEGDMETYREATAREEVYKLVINSMYGKLAQREPQFGKYTNMHWAAMITGETRAQVNEEIWSGEAAGGTPVYAHTDSVTFVGLERDDEGKCLGAWGKEDPKKGLFIIQPGLAIATEEGKHATRGVSKNVIVPFVKEWVGDHKEELREHPATWEAMYVEDTRMYSLRSASHIGKPWLAGSFHTKPQKVGFRSAKRSFDDAVPMGEDNPYAWKLPPKEMIHPDDVARLEHLQTYRNELRRQRLQGLWDDSKL